MIFCFGLFSVPQSFSLTFYSCLLIVSSIICFTESKVSYEGWKVQKVTPVTRRQVRDLQRLQRRHEVGDTPKLRFMESPEGLNKSIQILMSPDYDEMFERHFQKMGVSKELVIENLQKLLDSEKESESPANLTIDDFADFSTDQYHPADQMNAFLRSVARQRPLITKLTTIGYSSEGREILAIKIGKPSSNLTPKPAIWIDAGIHAREWIAPASAIYTIKKLVTDYDSDDSIKTMLTTMDWHVAPLVNPDGYEYSRTTDRFWRKTMSKQKCQFWPCCHGVDLNRNYGYKWGTTGTSTNPCNDVYRGPRAFSEPESTAIRDFVLLNNDTIKAFITLHSFSQMWLIPFGYGSPPIMPPDFDELYTLALQGAEAIRSVHGSKYRVGNSANLLYPASGSADDWAKGAANIKYAFTLELRPSDDHVDDRNGFILHKKNIIPAAEELFAGLMVVADKVMTDDANKE